MDLAGLEEEFPARREVAHLGDGEPEGPVGHELVGVQVELRREAGFGGGAQGFHGEGCGRVFQRGAAGAQRRQARGGAAAQDGEERRGGSVPVAARRPRASAAVCDGQAGIVGQMAFEGGEMRPVLRFSARSAGRGSRASSGPRRPRARRWRGADWPRRVPAGRAGRGRARNSGRRSRGRRRRCARRCRGISPRRCRW